MAAGQETGKEHWNFEPPHSFMPSFWPHSPLLILFFSHIFIPANFRLYTLLHLLRSAWTWTSSSWHWKQTP